MSSKPEVSMQNRHIELFQVKSVWLDGKEVYGWSASLVDDTTGKIEVECAGKYMYPIGAVRQLLSQLGVEPSSR